MVKQTVNTQEIEMKTYEITNDAYSRESGIIMSFDELINALQNLGWNPNLEVSGKYIIASESGEIVAEEV